MAVIFDFVEPFLAFRGSRPASAASLTLGANEWSAVPALIHDPCRSSRLRQGEGKKKGHPRGRPPFCAHLRSALLSALVVAAFLFAAALLPPLLILLILLARVPVLLAALLPPALSASGILLLLSRIWVLTSALLAAHLITLILIRHFDDPLMCRDGCPS
ncbi:hypothetical protein [Sphingobium bisphenolivorans]|uniref:hypothetical protein n=1 Tax=Sphingobium bisphenolivorans TaxID=1335760 RepID=UPI0003B47EAC|nr:hypothetical protein [Sphingobium bisphenolivorans]